MAHRALAPRRFRALRLFLRLVPLVVAVPATALIALHSTNLVVLDRAQLVGVIALLAVVSLIEGLERVIGGVVRERQLTQPATSPRPCGPFWSIWWTHPSSTGPRLASTPS